MIMEHSYYIKYERYESYLCHKFYPSLSVGHAKADFEQIFGRTYDYCFPCYDPNWIQYEQKYNFAAAAAMVLQPTSRLSLVYALPPEFSIFGFSFPSPHAE
jgi:hypothetical protein